MYVKNVSACKGGSQGAEEILVNGPSLLYNGTHTVGLCYICGRRGFIHEIQKEFECRVRYAKLMETAASLTINKEWTLRSECVESTDDQKCVGRVDNKKECR